MYEGSRLSWCKLHYRKTIAISMGTLSYFKLNGYFEFSAFINLNSHDFLVFALSVFYVN